MTAAKKYKFEYTKECRGYSLLPNCNAVEAQELANAGIIDSSKEFKTETRDRLFDVCNGCGAGNAKFDYVADKLGKLYIGHCCHDHDHKYEMGDTPMDRLRDDKEWLRNMYEMIMLYKAQYGWRVAAWKLRFQAWIYFKAVRWKGKSAFQKKTYESSQLRFNKANGFPTYFNIDEDTIMDVSTDSKGKTNEH